MESFNSDGVEIAFEVYGEGDPVLLIHGFASNGRVNWKSTGWVDTLTGDGRQAILIDNRGHGQSEKLYDESLYGAQDMAEDARRLLDHLGIERADIMGYSMGARISAFLSFRHPKRVRSVVIAGLAYNMVRGFGRGDAIADALEADSIDDVKDAEPRGFRAFAEKTGSDLKALAACMRSRGHKVTMDDLATIKAPTLVVAGSEDEVAGSIDPIVEIIPGARGLALPGKDHMTAVGDKTYKAEVLNFLAERP